MQNKFNSMNENVKLNTNVQIKTLNFKVSLQKKKGVKNGHFLGKL